MRLRAVYLDPGNKSDAYAPLAIPTDAIHINDKSISRSPGSHYREA
jgi:hypothetical protein